jgi:hypothetical protein
MFAGKAFKELKSVLISEPVIHYPNPNLPYALITEACLADSSNPGGYSAILAQIKPDGEFEVISYASRKLKLDKSGPYDNTSLFFSMCPITQ